MTGSSPSPKITQEIHGVDDGRVIGVLTSLGGDARDIPEAGCPKVVLAHPTESRASPKITQEIRGVDDGRVEVVRTSLGGDARDKPEAGCPKVVLAQPAGSRASPKITQEIRGVDDGRDKVAVLATLSGGAPHSCEIVDGKRSSSSR